jgi:hypothetical protein
MISDFLNKKNSLRNLPDDQFTKMLPHLAQGLSEESYYIRYSDEILRRDWKLLKNWSPRETGHTSSTVRVGMKLCEHFFPNFFHIRNSKGASFHMNWNQPVLEKVLVWNRKSHSTPYMSELRRGVYFCTGLTKNTMYRPHMAKSVAQHYNSKIVLDPCAGWGGRLLGTVAAGARYIGYEPNVETYTNLTRLVKFLEIEDRVVLYNLPAEKMGNHTYDTVLTSPPYFNLEVYGDGDGQSENYYKTYGEWRDLWLRPLITSVVRDGVISCWNVHNIGKMKLMDDVEAIHRDLGYHLVKSFTLSSSSRQTNQNQQRNKRTQDLTNCFRNVNLDT